MHSACIWYMHSFVSCIYRLIQFSLHFSLSIYIIIYLYMYMCSTTCKNINRALYSIDRNAVFSWRSVQCMCPDQKVVRTCTDHQYYTLYIVLILAVAEMCCTCGRGHIFVPQFLTFSLSTRNWHCNLVSFYNNTHCVKPTQLCLLARLLLAAPSFVSIARKRKSMKGGAWGWGLGAGYRSHCHGNTVHVHVHMKC